MIIKVRLNFEFQISCKHTNFILIITTVSECCKTVKDISKYSLNKKSSRPSILDDIEEEKLHEENIENQELKNYFISLNKVMPLADTQIMK